MTYKNIFTLHALVAAGFALSMLLIPEMVLGWYGVSAGPMLIAMTRFLGVAMASIGLVEFLARSAQPSAARLAIMQGVLVGELLAITVTLMAVLAGAMGPLLWFNVAIYALFILARTYVLLLAPASEPSGRVRTG